MSKAPFSDHNLLLGVTTKDAISLFSAEERRDGIEPALKERLIRTLVRNTYDYHQQEIFLTIANEYTDWSRSTPSRHDTLAEAAAAIADGTVVAPVVETGVLHAQAAQSSRSRATTHLLVFGSPGETGCASRPSGSPRSSSACTSVGSNVLPRDLLYLLGLPLRTSQSVLYPEFSRQEAKISQALIHYIRNFLRDGNPNGSSRGNGVPYYQGRSKDKQEPVVWPQFEPIHRMHLVLADGVARPDSHWNAHRLSIWNRLVPALHRPSRASGAGGGAGGAVVAQPGGAGGLAQASLSPLQLQVQLQRQQHQLLDDAANPATFAGSVRNLSFLLLPNGGGGGGGLLTPADVTPVGQQQRASQTDSGRLSSDASSPSSSSSSPGGANTLSGAQINDNSRKKTALSGGSQGDSDLVTPGSGPSSTTLNGGAISPLNALAALTTGPYSRPLLTVLTVGCSLLVVNLLVFVGTFCQHRERRASVAVATSGVASGSAAVASGNTRTTKSHSKNDDRGCATVKVADAEEALGGHNGLLLQRQQQQQQSEHTTSSKTLTIQDEDVCLQKTMLQKDAAMLFLQETTGNNSPSTLPHVSDPIGGEQRSEEDMLTEVANSSSAILGPLELEACFLYQMAPNFVTSTLPHGHRQGSISGRSIVLDGGAGGRKLTTTAATATAATTSESDPATLMSPATCPLPNVVPIGALGQTAGAHQSSQVTAATLLPQPDVAVTSAMSQSVTATMTFARHSSTHQYETHQQPTLKEPSRSAFKGGEETTV